jgi:hypothetical protein
MWTLVAHEGEIKYAPESKLLYVRLDEYGGAKQDVWIMAYLSEGELAPCKTLGTRESFALDALFGKPQEGDTI